MTKEEVLQECTVNGNVVKLPSGELDRKLYQEVAKSLVNIGGKWTGGKVFGFVFVKDPTDLLNEISNGVFRNIKKEFQFYGTPIELSMKLVRFADIQPSDTVLEPSCGRGGIISAINGYTHNIIPDCYELMEENRIILNKSNYKFNLIGEDFLAHSGKLYNKIIANPPFAKNQDIDHLRKMYECLEVGGRVVCITSESWVDGRQEKQLEFKEWLTDVNAKVYDIERGAFKQSGTMVGGKIVIIDKINKNK